MGSIENGEHVARRAEFLVRCAVLLDIPIIATEQVPEKLGPLKGELKDAIGTRKVYTKTGFSALSAERLDENLERLGRRSAVIVGVETHICVSGTALDLSDRGYDVAVCADAVGARSLERHKLGMERLCDAGISRCHTEGVLYEWLKSADHPRFKQALAFVKQFA